MKAPMKSLIFGKYVNAYARKPNEWSRTALLSYALTYRTHVDIVTFGQIKTKSTSFLDFVNNVVFKQNAIAFRCAPFCIGDCMFFYVRHDFPRITAADFKTIYDTHFSNEELALPPTYRFNFGLQSYLIRHICRTATYGLTKSIATRRKKMKQKGNDSKSEFVQGTLF